MWRFWGRGFLLLILFSFFAFREDFERVCDEEIAKEDFNITIVQNSCQKAGDKALKDLNYESASWYYLLSGKCNKVIHEFTDINNSLVIYSNLAHCYILKNKFQQAKETYETILTFTSEIDEDIGNDYKLLKKLYPNKNKELNNGFRLWEKSSKIFTEISELIQLLDNIQGNSNKHIKINLLKKIIHLKNKTILRKDSSTTINYYNLALLYEEEQEHDKAIENFNFSLQIANKILKTNHTQIAIIHNDIAINYQEIKKYQLAIGEYQKSLKIYQLTPKKNQNEIAMIYNNIATVYKDLKLFETSLKYYKKALLIEEENPSKSIIDTYYNQGLLFLEIKQYDKVLLSYKKSFPYISKNSLEMATYYMLLGSYYQEIEENQNALKYYQKALEIRKKKLHKYHINLAESYNALGSIYEVLKDYQKALIYYTHALKINTKLLKKNDINLAIIHNNIASVYTELKKYNKAKIHILKTLEIKKNLFKKEDINFAVTYSNLGFILENIDEKENALYYYQKALKLYLNSLGKNSLEVAIMYNNLASVAKSESKYLLAIEYLKKSKNIMETILTTNHTYLALNYNNLGLLYEYIHQYKKSYHYNLQSFYIFLHNRNKNFKILDNHQKSLYLQSFGNRLDNLYSSSYLYMKNKDLKAQDIRRKIFKTWLNYKGTLFEYQNILSMLKNNPKTQKETRENIKKLNTSNILLSKLNSQYTKNKRRIKKVEEEIHNLEVILSKDNQLFKHLLDLNDINSTQIASRLKENQLYIDFARATDNYYIFTLDHENTITFQQIDENDTKKIDNDIKAFQHKMQEMAKMTKENRLTKTVLKKSKEESQKILQKLYTSIIDNYLKEIIKTKHHLIISPDGLLNFLPFEALYNQKNYLIEKYQVSYISSGKELLRQNNNRKNNNSSEVVIFGSPDFWFQNQKSSLTKSSITKENATIFDIKFSPLNISKKEIEVMKSYYPKLKIYTDSNATVENLFKIKNPKILHISTHGFFLNNKNNPNPMLASGLAFAGANYANFKDDARGIATALQLSGLELQNTELVVLSACESGLGKIHSAEGITGLPKAFIQAGAKKVMSSLWKISSRKTVTIIDNFYANIHAGNSYTTALRKAKLQMITTHPYYWSAFIMSGI